MLDVALRQLSRNPGRTLARALAVGGAMSLPLLFEGSRLGIDRQMAAFVAGLPADLVAVEAGKSHFIGAGSRLPQGTRAAIERIPGVLAAHPLVVVAVILEHAGRRSPMQLVAYDTAGAPRNLAAGHPIDGPHQIIIDARLARIDGVRAGDHVRLLDRDFQVVGLSVDTDVSFDPFAFITYDELIDTYLDSDVPGAMGGAPLLSYLLVQLVPGNDAGATRAAVEAAVPTVDLFSPEQLARNDVRFGRQLFGSVLDLLIGIGWVAVILAVGLTTYASVLDRRNELGVMKALGVRPRGVVALVVEEAALVTLVAIPLALAFARGGAAAIESWSPLYRVIPWDPAVVPRAVAAGASAALIGALLPLRRVIAVEPDLVFRS